MWGNRLSTLIESLFDDWALAGLMQNPVAMNKIKTFNVLI